MPFFESSRMKRAIDQGDVQKILALIEDGVDLRRTWFDNNEGTWGYLTYAMKQKQQAAAILLVQHGLGDTAGHHPDIHEAVACGNEVIVGMLLDRNPALIHLKDGDGDTPLHIAAQEERSKVASLLLDRGADANALNKASRTPFFYAQKKINPELENILSPHTRRIAAVPADEWKKLSAVKIAHRSADEEGIGCRITDIFNFAAQERLRLVQDLESGAMAAETKAFRDITDHTAIDTARAELIRRGGTPAEDGNLRLFDKQGRPLGGGPKLD